MPRAVSAAIRSDTRYRVQKYLVAETESGVNRLVSMSLFQICFQIAKIRNLTDTGQENTAKPAKNGRKIIIGRLIPHEIDTSPACTIHETHDSERSARHIKNWEGCDTSSPAIGRSR